MKSLYLLCLLSSVLYSCIANATTYKWVDENGVTHFSQSRPDNAEYTILQQKKFHQKTPAKKQTKDLTPPNSTQENSAEMVQRIDGKETLSKEKCEQLKLDLEKLTTIPRIRVKHGDTTKYLTDEEKQTMMDERIHWIENYCQ